MADIALLLVVNGLDHLEHFALPGHGNYLFAPVVDEEPVIALVHRLADFGRIGRLQYDPVGVENPHTQHLVILPDHLQYDLDILGIADPH